MHGRAAPQEGSDLKRPRLRRGFDVNVVMYISKHGMMMNASWPQS